MGDFKWRHFRGEIILWAVRWTGTSSARPLLKPFAIVPNLSLSELQTAYPSLRSNDLLSFDVNRDGRISFNELYSADAIEVLGENK